MFVITVFASIWLLWLPQLVTSYPATHGSNFYWLSTDKRNFTEAEEFCVKIGGHLLWIEDNDEQMWLSSVLALYETTLYWLTGMVDLTAEGGQHNLSWTSGADVTFTNLADREPSNGQEQCVTMEKPMAFKWADVFCNRKEAFICKANISTLSHRMKVYGHRKYILAEAELDFVNAHSYCRALEADLVQITDADELNWLVGQMPFGSQWYTGLYRVVYDGDSTSFWTTGAKVTAMSDQVPTGGRCMVVNSSGSMNWSDCIQKEMFICKLESWSSRQNSYGYWFDQELRTAADGQRFCEGLGGDLAWISSSVENNRLGVYMASHHPSVSSWLLGYRGQRDTTCWHGNFTCGYQNFRRQISEDASNLCVSMSTRKFFQWEQTSCADKAPTACKIHNEFEKSYRKGIYLYLFSTTKLNYTQAAMYCRQLGGNLVWIDNQVEELWIRRVLEAHFSDIAYWFIGLYDHVGNNNDADYRWIGGQKRKFTNFAAREPRAPHEKCITMERPLAYKWADVNCTRKEAFVCKIISKAGRTLHRNLL